MANISLAQLLEAGVHFGHKAYRWNPKMFPYIYMERNNIHILDLVQSAQLLKQANNYLQSAAEQKKTFLFIGTKRQASTLIAQEAKRCNSYYVNHRWLGGMLTNWVTLKSRIVRLKVLEQQEVDEVFKLLPKKEASLRKTELDKLRRDLDGIKHMENLPDVAIVIDQKRERMICDLFSKVISNITCIDSTLLQQNPLHFSSILSFSYEYQTPHVEGVGPYKF